MGVCSCVSSQKAVIVIGVLTGITSTVLSVVVVAAYVTLEEQVRDCRSPLTRHTDHLKLLPSCTLLADASFVLSSRVFMLVQVTLWLLLLVFSVLLVMGAIKARAGLLVPWIVLLLVVMGSIVYDAVRAGIKGDTTSLLISISALATATLCILIVNSHSREIRKRHKAAEASASLRLFSNPVSSSGYDNMHRHTPPFLYAGRPGARYITYEDIAMCHDLPPDYDTAADTIATAQAGQKIKLATSLGVRR